MKKKSNLMFHDFLATLNHRCYPMTELSIIIENFFVSIQNLI